MQKEEQIGRIVIRELYRREIIQARELEHMAFVESEQRSVEEMQAKELRALEARQLMEQARQAAERRQMEHEEQNQCKINTIERKLEANEREYMNFEECELRKSLFLEAEIVHRETLEMAKNEQLQENVFKVLDRRMAEERVAMTEDEFWMRNFCTCEAHNLRRELSQMELEATRMREINAFWEMRRKVASFGMQKCAALLQSRSRSRINVAMRCWLQFSRAVAFQRAGEVAKMAAEEGKQREINAYLAELEAKETQSMHAEFTACFRVFRALDYRIQSECRQMSRDEEYTRSVWKVIDQKCTAEIEAMFAAEMISREAEDAERERSSIEISAMHKEDELSFHVFERLNRYNRKGFAAADAAAKAWRFLLETQRRVSIEELKAMAAEEIHSAALALEIRNETYEQSTMAIEEARCIESVKYTSIIFRKSLHNLATAKRRFANDLERRSAINMKELEGQNIPTSNDMETAVSMHFPAVEENRLEAMKLSVSDLTERSAPLKRDDSMHIDGIVHQPIEALEEQLTSLRSFAEVMRMQVQKSYIRRDAAQLEKAKVVPEFLAFKQFCELQRASCEGTHEKTLELTKALKEEASVRLEESESEDIPVAVRERIEKSEECIWTTELAEFKRKSRTELEEAIKQMKLDFAKSKRAHMQATEAQHKMTIAAINAEIRAETNEIQDWKEKVSSLEGYQEKLKQKLFEAEGLRDKDKPMHATLTRTRNYVFELWNSNQSHHREKIAFCKSVEGMPVFANTQVCKAYKDQSLRLQQKLNIQQLMRRIQTLREQLDLVGSMLHSSQSITSDKAIFSLESKGLKLTPSLKADATLMINHLSNFKIVAANDFTKAKSELDLAMKEYNEHWDDKIKDDSIFVEDYLSTKLIGKIVRKVTETNIWNFDSEPDDDPEIEGSNEQDKEENEEENSPPPPPLALQRPLHSTAGLVEEKRNS